VTYLIKRGPAAVKGRCHAHLAKYNNHGRIVGPWCPATGLDMSSNVPWGLKTCKHCIRLANS
jgi:hypothetical protein